MTARSGSSGRSSPDVAFEDMTDEQWAATLAVRISGSTGEVWMGTGIKQAILVAMGRARTQERASCALLCDGIVRSSDTPRDSRQSRSAAYKSGAAKCAWEIRQRKGEHHAE